MPSGVVEGVAICCFLLSWVRGENSAELVGHSCEHLPWADNDECIGVPKRCDEQLSVFREVDKIEVCGPQGDPFGPATEERRLPPDRSAWGRRRLHRLVAE